jgi:hypothetical protein
MISGIDKELLLFSFEQPDSIHSWFPTDDVVMGGVSRSRIVASPHNTALFTGLVSLENNGGFAAVRSRSPTMNLHGFDGLTLRIKSDGKRYGVNIKTTGSAEALLYQIDFNTDAEQWTDIVLPFRAFSPRLVGFPVCNAPPLDVGRVGSLGLMIADKQSGSFALELAWIKAYRGNFDGDVVKSEC